MNDSKVFDFGGVDVRVLMRDNEPWWVAKDVCDVLGLMNARMATAELDDDEKDGVKITDAIGREQTTTVVNAFGFYSLVLRSRKPEAKSFKRWITEWITHEMLPQIYKTGAFASKKLSTLERLMLTALEEQERRAREQDERLTQVEAKIGNTLEPEYFSVLGFANLRGIRLYASTVAAIERHAAARSKLDGYEIKDVPHASYGRISAYHSKVLAVVFEQWGKGV